MRPTATFPMSCARWTLVLAFYLTAGVAVATPVSPIEDSTAQKELFQARLDAVKEMQQKDINFLRERMEAQDRTIATLERRMESQLTQTGQAVDRFGVIAGILGTIVTLLLALVGAVAYFSVKRKTKIEAEKAARHWFETHSATLEQEIMRLRCFADQGCRDIDQHVDRVSNSAKKAQEVIEDRRDDFSRLAGEIDSRQSVFTENEMTVLRERDAELRKVPEASYSFDDWNTRAHAAYEAKHYMEASMLWEQAAAIPNAGAEKVAQVLVNKGVALRQLEREEESLKAYDEVVERFEKDPAPAIRVQVARALVYKGVALSQFERQEEAISAYNGVVERFGKDTAPVIREQIANALFNKGNALGQFKRGEEAIEAYDEVVERFDKDAAPAIRVQVANAFVNKGVTLGQLDRAEEAINAWSEVVKRFGKDTSPTIFSPVAAALFNKGNELGRLDRGMEAIQAYDEMVKRFGKNPAPAFCEHVAKALVNKGNALERLDRVKDAIKEWEEVVKRFGEDPAPALREQVALAFIFKGSALIQLKHEEEAINAWSEVVKRFGEDPAPALRDQVANALNGLGFMKLLEAKKAWTLEPDAARAHLESARENLERAATYTSKPSGMILANHAYVAWLMGDAPLAETLFQSALTAEEDGGKELYEESLKDIDKHPIAEDAGFRVLVERLWAARSESTEQPGTS